MKHQYFGDVNDYVKYGLLRCFSNAGLTAGVCWMLTPDDGSSDGRKLEYLGRPEAWRHHDAELYSYLAQVVRTPGGRHLGHIEAGQALPNTQFFGDIVPTSPKDRSAWFARVIEQLGSCELLFLDPDNGIEVPSRTLGSRNSPKYVYWTELSLAWQQGASLLVFQHFPRKARPAFIAATASRLRARLSGAEVTSVVSSNVLFMLAGQPKHRACLAAAMEAIRAKWSPRVAARDDEA